MPDQEFHIQSRAILDCLGRQLSQIFDPTKMDDDAEINALLAKLNEVPSDRDTDLARAGERLMRLLEKNDVGLRNSPLGHRLIG